MALIQQKKNHTSLVSTFGLFLLLLLGLIYHQTSLAYLLMNEAHEDIVSGRISLAQADVDDPEILLNELQNIQRILNSNQVLLRLSDLNNQTQRTLQSLQLFLINKPQSILNKENFDKHLEYLQEQVYLSRIELNQGASKTVVLFGLLVILTMSVLLIITSRLEKEKKARIWDKQVAGDFISREEDLKRTIAQELHDDIAQTLALAKISNNRESQDLIGDAINKIRILTRNLNLPVRMGSHLGISIQELVEMYREIGNFTLEFHLAGELQSMTNVPLNTHVYRIIQELLQNTLKHSNAGKVSLSIHRSSELLSLRYADDGIGMPKSLYSRGMGLQNIRDRVTMVNGKLDVQTSPGNGLRVSLDIPCI